MTKLRTDTHAMFSLLVTLSFTERVDHRSVRISLQSGVMAAKGAKSGTFPESRDGVGESMLSN